MSDTSYPNYPVMIVEAKCARGDVLLCCLSRRVDTFYILRIGFLSIKITIRELVGVQVCDQVSHHCNGIGNLTFNLRGRVFSNMTIRTKFHPYYITNYTFGSRVNDFIILYPQPAMSIELCFAQHVIV